MVSLPQAQRISVLIHLAASVHEVPSSSQKSVRKKGRRHLHQRGSPPVACVASDSGHVDNRYGPVDRGHRHDCDRRVRNGEGGGGPTEKGGVVPVLQDRGKGTTAHAPCDRELTAQVKPLESRIWNIQEHGKRNA